ncbi:MAG: HAD-IIB family hydrolase [Proteobacteria bacterium]|nr:HAD-IIB family hydrolase [Pseudomonadota bacterium]
MSKSAKQNIRFILTDIDDTLTHNGRLPAIAYASMERLKEAGKKVIPITGRPAGWCDHFARMWPIDALVGENGAFYFQYNDTLKKMERCYWKSQSERSTDRKKLSEIKEEVLRLVPGCGISADQPYREADLAFDFCEDVEKLSEQKIQQIVSISKKAGAEAVISSIHVNVWFGKYSKLAMTCRLLKDAYGLNLEQIKDHVMFIGDSPNDVTMFGYFPMTVGVANVLRFKHDLEHTPTWITSKEGGFGFAEMTDVLLQ